MTASSSWELRIVERFGCTQVLKKKVWEYVDVDDVEGSFFNGDGDALVFNGCVVI